MDDASNLPFSEIELNKEKCLKRWQIAEYLRRMIFSRPQIG